MEYTGKGGCFTRDTNVREQPLIMKVNPFHGTDKKRVGGGGGRGLSLGALTYLSTS